MSGACFVRKWLERPVFESKSKRVVRIFTFLFLILSYCGTLYANGSTGGQCHLLLSKLNDSPISFKSDDGIGIPQLDSFLLGPKFLNFRPAFLSRLLKKSYRTFSGLVMSAFEGAIGLNRFNNDYYVPVKEFYNQNYEKILKQAQESSLYSLEDHKELIPIRVFVEAVFMFMEVEYNSSTKNLLSSKLVENVPPPGEPGIFVLNHPYGLIDTLIAARLMMQVRPDIKFVANSIMSKIAPEAKSLLLDLNVMAGDSGDGNDDTMKAAKDHINSGGMIIIFPDAVLPVRDPWYSSEAEATQKYDFKRGLGQLFLSAPDATVVMGNLTGGSGNSWMFHGLGKVHQWAKIAMLLREFMRTKGVQDYQINLAPQIDNQKVQSIVDSMAELHREKLQNMSDLEKSKFLSYAAAKVIEAEYRRYFLSTK